MPNIPFRGNSQKVTSFSTFYAFIVNFSFKVDIQLYACLPYMTGKEVLPSRVLHSVCKRRRAYNSILPNHSSFDYASKREGVQSLIAVTVWNSLLAL